MTRGTRIVGICQFLATLALGGCALVLLDRFLTSNLPAEESFPALFGLYPYPSILRGVVAILTAAWCVAMWINKRWTAIAMHNGFLTFVAVLSAPTLLSSTSFPWTAIISPNLHIVAGVSPPVAFGLGAVEVTLAFLSRSLLEQRLAFLALEGNDAGVEELLAAQSSAVLFYMGLLAGALALTALGLGVAFALQIGFRSLVHLGSAFVALLVLIPVTLLLTGLGIVFARSRSQHSGENIP